MEINNFNEFIRLVEDKEIKLKLTIEKKPKLLIQIESFITETERRQIKVLTPKESKVEYLLKEAFKRNLMSFNIPKIKKLVHWRDQGLLDYVVRQNFNSLTKYNPKYFDELLLEVMKKNEMPNFKDKYLRMYYVGSAYEYIEEWEMIMDDIDYEIIKDIQHKSKWLIKKLEDYVKVVSAYRKKFYDKEDFDSEQKVADIQNQLEDLKSRLQPLIESSIDSEEELISLYKKGKVNEKSKSVFSNRLISLDDDKDQLEEGYKSFQADFRKLKKELNHFKLIFVN